MYVSSNDSHLPWHIIGLGVTTPQGHVSSCHHRNLRLGVAAFRFIEYSTGADDRSLLRCAFRTPIHRQNLSASDLDVGPISDTGFGDCYRECVWSMDNSGRQALPNPRRCEMMHRLAKQRTEHLGLTTQART